MKLALLLFAPTLLLLSSCAKKKSCANAMKLTVASVKPTIGDDVEIKALKESDFETYQWYGPGVNETNQSNVLRIDDIKLSQSGVYYCTKNNTDCGTTLHDSVRIDVQLKQETPPCTPTNNTVTSSSIPGVTFTNVTKSYDISFNAVTMYANGAFGYPPFTVVFNSYNGNVEPKDGTYITTEGYTFNPLQEPNEISISFIYASNFYHCSQGNSVYVKHVNGKLQLTFCNLEFASPPYPAVTASGKITQL